MGLKRKRTGATPAAKRRKLSRRRVRKLRFKARKAKGGYTTVPRTVGTLVPQKMTFKARWNDYRELALTAGTTGYNTNAGLVWRANSIFDPCYAATGNFNLTASMYRYFAGIYGKYCVLSSRILVVARQKVQPLGLYDPTKIVLRRDKDLNPGPANSTVKWTDFLSDRNSCVREYRPNNNYDCKTTLKMGYKMKKQFSANDPLARGAQLVTFGSNPAETVYFYVLVMPKDGANTWWQNQMPIGFDIVVRFNVEFSEAKDLADRDPGQMIEV